MEGTVGQQGKHIKGTNMYVSDTYSKLFITIYIYCEKLLTASAINALIFLFCLGADIYFM